MCKIRWPSALSPTPQNSPCFVAPDPALLESLERKRELLLSEGLTESLRRFRTPEPGLNDGLMRPPRDMAAGLSFEAAVEAASAREPLRGPLNVLVVLVEFPDLRLATPASHFEDLFFSAKGSVNDFYSEASNGLVSITGQVIGPFLLPQTLKHYADGRKGQSDVIRTMALDALYAADAGVDFGPYDNDRDGYVDAFVIVHAGRGAEQTNSPNDIWSHKWTLPGNRAVAVDGSNAFAYLTIPEDAKLGVSAHELGHLLFGWPDLYDGDYSSRGVGNYCLMGGGSWNGGGDLPCHPSAWCKATQGWISVISQDDATGLVVEDVKTSRTAYQVWTKGQAGPEYFLAEMRRKAGYDALIPAEGLFVWHIDEAVPDNTNEWHPKVALVQADGQRDLERRRNSGDEGDTFPGSRNVTRCDGSTPASTRAYSGAETGVALTAIQTSGTAVTFTVAT